MNHRYGTAALAVALGLAFSRGQAQTPAPKAEPKLPSAAPRDGLAQWSADILKAVRDLREAAQHAPRPAGDEERRLWENVRQLQMEIVNLQGTLLSPPKPL